VNLCLNHDPEAVPDQRDPGDGDMRRMPYWLHSLPAAAATAAPVTPMTLPNAIRSRSKSIGARESVGRLAVTTAEQIFSLAWEPGKERLQLRCGSLELSNGPLRTAAVLYLPSASAAPQQAITPCVTSIGSSVPVAYLAVVIRKPYPRPVLRFPSATRSPMLTVALGLLEARGGPARGVLQHATAIDKSVSGS
jgi:hypothetical protein